MKKLKTINAILGLLSAALLLIHIGYCSYCYLTFFYDPTLVRLTALPFIITFCLHAVCAMISVFTLSDGTRLDLYPRLNRNTLIQRISAAFLFPLLIAHLKTFGWLQSSAAAGNWLFFALVILLQTLFYAVIILHTLLSVPRGLVTLGWLSSPEKRKTIERAAWIAGTVIFLFASFAIVRGEIAMIPVFIAMGVAP